MSTLLIRARRAATSTEDVTPSGFYGSLQWMPPGESTISASVNGTAKKVKVIATEETAKLVDRRIKEMIHAAEGGKGALPYIDFDHEDCEASGWALGASWGGSDPLTGGVRLNIEWSEAGRARVRGKSYQGFSPEFLLKDDAVSGVGLNLGGLVNRPAFTGIQRVTAAQAAIDADYIGQNMTHKSTDTFFVKAAQLQSERGLKSIDEASLVLARENSALYDTYRANLCRDQDREEIVDSRAFDADTVDFLIQAKHIASSRNIDLVEALGVVSAQDPALYTQYRAKILGMKTPVLTQAKATSGHVEKTEFLIQAKSMAREGGIDLIDAALRLATANPGLYEDYRKMFGRS